MIASKRREDYDSATGSGVQIAICANKATGGVTRTIDGHNYTTSHHDNKGRLTAGTAAGTLDQFRKRLNDVALCAGGLDDSHAADFLKLTKEINKADALYGAFFRQVSAR